MMTAQQYLSTLSEMKFEIDSAKEKYQEYISMAMSTAGHPIDQERVQSSQSDNGKVERYSVLATDLAAEIQQMQCDYFVKQNRVINQIRKLHNVNYNKMLYKVYVQFKTIPQAAAEMNHSRSWGQKTHDDALKKFREVNGKKKAKNERNEHHEE